MTPLPPIPGHHLLLVLVQTALLLVAARLLGEGAKRLGQPAVIGELLAGIVLGPSLFGWIAPGAFAALFPREPAQFHLIELLGWMGMVLLMLLTGLETDVRRLRHLGRAAAYASLLGMLVPFALGYGFALALPARVLAPGADRGLFATFFATAMAISAMPIIAKVLRDLEITGRDVGVLILTAGVVDDTAGWLVLSVIAGMVKGSFSAPRLLQTVALTAAFLVVTAVLLYPAARWLFRVVGDRFHTRDNDLTLVVVIAFVAAAATEGIGVHPVFGAFVAGCVLRQVPRLRHASLQRLESVVLAIFAPLFFGLVGLKVDLRSAGVFSTSAGLLLAALAMATAGKVIGCTAGGLLGRLPFWEALSVGVGMNARGAMGLVVALIGLDLGIVSPTIYAVLVVIAIATSFMAPIGLRFTLTHVAMSEAERARRAAGEGTSGLFSPGAMRALLLTAGGPNALAAARIAGLVLHGADASVTALYVEPAGARPRLRAGLRRALRRGPAAGTGLEESLAAARALATARGATFSDVVREGDPAAEARREAARDTDLVLTGMGPTGDAIGGPVLKALLSDPPAHLVLAHAGRPGEDGVAPAAPRGRVLAISDGSHASRAAVELAVTAAEASRAELTVLHVLDPGTLAEEDLPEGPFGKSFREMLATTLMDAATPRLRTARTKVKALVEQADALAPPALREAASGDYDLVVLGAEHRAALNRLSVGYEIERLVQAAPCAVALVVPKIGA